MAWIELQQSLWTHRKTYALAEALSIDEVHAGGLVARLWCWALDNAQADYEHRRGLLTGVVPRAIAGGAGWKGDASSFFYALIDAGFLDNDGDDIVIPWIAHQPGGLRPRGWRTIGPERRRVGIMVGRSLSATAGVAWPAGALNG